MAIIAAREQRVTTVAAAGRDRVWVIGMDAADDLSTSPGHWRGLNLLGFALMDARHQLRWAPLRACIRYLGTGLWSMHGYRQYG